MNEIKKVILLGIIFPILLSGCMNPAPEMLTNTPSPVEKEPISEALDEPPTPVPTTTEAPFLQPLSKSLSYGPNAEDFPEGINPLTGQPVPDPAQLKEPALLISIPHFPSVARPQAGISFAPWVFEFLIAEGTTRFLATFYGEMPYQETPILGDCEMRIEPFVQTDLVLGNFIWLDKNENGIQDVDERGVGGVCVKLLDTKGNVLEETSSDSNGYYGFNINAGIDVHIEVALPPDMTFTLQDVGFDDLDSDINPETGRSTVSSFGADERNLDVGLLPSDNILSKNNEVEPTFGEQVGPVRSGRLVYIPIHESFQYSCLIFAGATWQIEDLIPRCATVYGVGDGAGGFLDIERMERISAENAEGLHSDFNYAGNIFSETSPEGGSPAKELDIFTSILNQSKWVYDPLHQGWLRYVGDVSEDPTFAPEIDRLTGRDLIFQNVILLEVDHTVWAPRIIEMSLGSGLIGNATLFRDGQKYDIRWSTYATEYSQKIGKRNPIRFVDKDNNPVALRPGHTWLFITTPYSVLEESPDQLWKLRIYSPEGAGEY